MVDPLSLIESTLHDPEFLARSPGDQLKIRDRLLIPALLSDPEFTARPPAQQQLIIQRTINDRLPSLTSSVEQVTQEPTVPDEGPGLIPQAAEVATRAAGAVVGPIFGGVAEGVKQLSRPAFGLANVAKHLINLRSPLPGEPGKTLPEVLKTDFAQPFMRGMTLDEQTTGPEVAGDLAKRLRETAGLPEPVPGSTAAKLTKAAEMAAGFAMDVVNPATLATFAGLGAAGKALAKSGPVVRGLEAMKAAMPDVFKVRYGAPDAYKKLADFTESTISNRTEDVLKQGAAMVDDLTMEERLRAAVLMQSPELRAGMRATVGDTRDVIAAEQARDAEVIARAAFAQKAYGPYTKAPQLSQAKLPSGKLVEAETNLLRYRKVPEPGDATILNYVNPARKALDGLTKELEKDYLQAGFVSPATRDKLVEVLEKNLGKYLPRMYAIFEQKAPLARPPGSDLAQLLPRTDKQLEAVPQLDPEAATELVNLMHWAAENAQKPSFAARLMGIPQAVLAKRTNPMEVYRQGLGAIEDLAYPYVKKSVQLIRTVVTARFFTTISENPAWMKTVRTAGYTEMPNEISKFGPLAGKFVQENIAKDLLSTMDPFWQNYYVKQWVSDLSAWKFGKVVLNPGTHSRNNFTNVIMLDFSGVDLAAQPAYYIRAILEMKRGGRAYVDLRNAGGLGREYVGGELDGLLQQVESLKPTETMLGMAFKQAPRAVAASAARLYQKEEQVAKLVKFMWERDHGLSVAEAAQKAEDWLFNYSKVSPFLKVLRQLPLGSPFATFSAKVLPRIVETAITEPWRIAKYQILFNSLENETKRKYGLTDRELARLKSGYPGYAIVLPVKNAEGKFMILDLSYLLPWGNITEMGSFASFLPQAFSPGGPALGAVEVVSGVDFYKKNLGQPHEFREVGKGLPTGFTPAQATANQAVRAFLPPLTPGIPGVTGPGVKPQEAGQDKSYLRRLGEAGARSGGYGAQKIAAALSGLPDRKGRVRSGLLTAADVLAGIKISPVDLEEKRVQEIYQYLNLRGRAINPETGKDYPTGSGLEGELMRIVRDQSYGPAAKRQMLREVEQAIAALDATRPGQRR